MKISKIFAGVCACSLAVLSAIMPCAAEGEAAESSDGYGRAGIVWMIKDQWDHRNTLDTEALNEMETDAVSSTSIDVNITGNGQYEVSLTGYKVSDDDFEFVEVGTLGVEFAIDFDAYPDMTVTLDECVIDGQTYTFNSQPELEESELGKVMKIKNAYGTNADTTPEMDAKPWSTTDPITVKFTIAGLDADKIADNPDENIEKVFGNGSVDNDEEEDWSVIEPELPGTEDSEEASEDSAETDASSVAETSSVSDNSDESGVPGWVIYVCIGAGVVVIIIVVAVIAKKKS